ncbi:MAG: glycoside hydrolase family 3 N-terminal domain-containing protein [Salibacter sp.]|uniref:glycoside hydrolase family 3 N-terminal domain-containing protein n=1 Tax=Salibacter sp. TaxID=2010995 RepID=UPI002870132C|nr:glycoside hydrolase family 3 N-terminal domain-containing protein [Salibacter sp.]MDR9398472.1 glycoside hydrolase family 3 N-terminal domain-containing protein [Salibacter sp.]
MNKLHLSITLVLAFFAVSFHDWQKVQVDPDFETAKSPWADSVLNGLTLEEKIGQLFMVAAYSNKDEQHAEEIDKLIEKHNIGGLIFFQGTPYKQAKLTNRYQKKSTIPLLIGMDAEWGLSMRLDSAMRFPRSMMVSAADNDSLTTELGRAMAQQLKRIGVHVNFAPVVDVNNNPDNPVINSRSFGEDKLRVVRMGKALSKGLQDEGVIAVAKHFPGHGDTKTDSHKELPKLPFDRNRLESLELFPFQEMIDHGVGGIMVAHLNVPALVDEPNIPTTLSKSVVTDLLKKEMNFNGLTFTDALNMNGVTEGRDGADVALEAFLAGNDVLLFPTEIPSAIKAIKNEIKRNGSLEKDLNERVLKILKAKEWTGATKFDSINLKNIGQSLNQPNHVQLNRDLNARAQTLVHNNGKILPFGRLDSLNIANLYFGENDRFAFQDELQLYGNIKTVYSNKKPTSFERKLIREELQSADVVIASLHNTRLYPTGNFGITNESLSFIKELAKEKEVILVHFGNPYALRNYDALDSLSAILVSYEESEFAQHYAAEALFGAVPVSGKLPVTIDQHYIVGSGARTKKIKRFTYSEPQTAGLNPQVLSRITSIAQHGIDEQAYPGCQILVARKGKVVYHKAMGKHTYEDNAQRVALTDIYDLASITKIAATVSSLMILTDRGELNVNNTLGDFIPEFVDGTDYENLKIKDILTHHAGLKSWIPFYKNTLSNGVPRYDVYSVVQSEMYPHRVAENFYIEKSYPDSIIKRIVETPLSKNQDYLYSDLGYYFMQRIIQKVTGQSLDEFATENIYMPIGMGTTRYLPREHFDLDRIVPTEYDVYFRQQLIHGDVHDPGAAMLGGVGGHAGLFSNANDLAKLMQTFLNNGSYGGVNIFSDSVIKNYTECLYCEDPEVENRRGIGFDKPVRDDDGGPTCQCVSYASFGHTGFTGTMAWADPEQDIVYVFLSNRIYPSAANKKLITMDIRTDIMQVIYDSIEY